MRAKATLIVVMLLAAGSTYGQVPTRTLPVTPLEGLATQPGARTMWSKFIGRLDGRSASAIVTAIAMATDAPAPRVMRGVRIELRHEGLRPDCNQKHVEWSVMCARENAAVYIEEDRIEPVRAAMLGGSAQVRPGGDAIGITHFGGTNGDGVLISGYLLYNVTLQQVSSLLADAAVQLKTAPQPR